MSISPLFRVAARLIVAGLIICTERVKAQPENKCVQFYTINHGGRVVSALDIATGDVLTTGTFYNRKKSRIYSLEGNWEVDRKYDMFGIQGRSGSKQRLVGIQTNAVSEETYGGIMGSTRGGTRKVGHRITRVGGVYLPENSFGLALAPSHKLYSMSRDVDRGRWILNRIDCETGNAVELFPIQTFDTDKVIDLAYSVKHSRLFATDGIHLWTIDPLSTIAEFVMSFDSLEMAAISFSPHDGAFYGMGRGEKGRRMRIYDINLDDRTTTLRTSTGLLVRARVKSAVGPFGGGALHCAMPILPIAPDNLGEVCDPGNLVGPGRRQCESICSAASCCVVGPTIKFVGASACFDEQEEKCTDSYGACSSFYLTGGTKDAGIDDLCQPGQVSLTADHRLIEEDFQLRDLRITSNGVQNKFVIFRDLSTGFHLCPLDGWGTAYSSPTGTRCHGGWTDQCGEGCRRSQCESVRGSWTYTGTGPYICDFPGYGLPIETVCPHGDWDPAPPHLQPLTGIHFRCFSGWTQQCGEGCRRSQCEGVRGLWTYTGTGPYICDFPSDGLPIQVVTKQLKDNVGSEVMANFYYEPTSSTGWTSRQYSDHPEIGRLTNIQALTSRSGTYTFGSTLQEDEIPNLQPPKPSPYQVWFRKKGLPEDQPWDHITPSLHTDRYVARSLQSGMTKEGAQFVTLILLLNFNDQSPGVFYIHPASDRLCLARIPRYIHPDYPYVITDVSVTSERISFIFLGVTRRIQPELIDWIYVNRDHGSNCGFPLGRTPTGTDGQSDREWNHNTARTSRGFHPSLIGAKDRRGMNGDAVDFFSVGSSRADLIYYYPTEDGRFRPYRDVTIGGGANVEGQPRFIYEAHYTEIKSIPYIILLGGEENQKRLWIVELKWNTILKRFENPNTWRWVEIGDSLITLDVLPQYEKDVIFFGISRNTATRNLPVVTRYYQSPDSTWHSEDIQEPSSPEANVTTESAFVVDLQISHKVTGIPCSNVDIELTSTEFAEIQSNGTTYHLDNFHPVVLNTALDGKLRFAMKADSLMAPEFRAHTPGLMQGKALVIRPNAHSIEKLSNVKEDEVKARLKDGYQGRVGNITKALRESSKLGLTSSEKGDFSAFEDVDFLSEQPYTVGLAVVDVAAVAVGSDGFQFSKLDASFEHEDFALVLGGDAVAEYVPLASDAASQIFASATDVANTAWGFIGNFFRYVYNQIRQSISKVKQFVVQGKNLAIQIGNVFIRAVADSIQHVANFVELIAAEVLKATDSLVEWFKDLFGWTDIINTNSVFSHLVKQHFRILIANVELAQGFINNSFVELSGKLTSRFDDAINILRSSADKGSLLDIASGLGEGDPNIGSDPLNPAALSKTVTSLRVQANYITDKATSVDISSSSLAKIDDVGVNSDIIINELEKLANADRFNDITASAERLIAEFDKIRDNPELLFTLGLANLLALVRDGIARDVINIVFTIVIELLKGLLAFMDQSLDDIPVLSKFYERISGGQKLTLLNLGTMALACPTTIIYKAVGMGTLINRGDVIAPFSKEEVFSLTEMKHDDGTTGWQVPFPSFLFNEDLFNENEDGALIVAPALNPSEMIPMPVQVAVAIFDLLKGILFSLAGIFNNGLRGVIDRQSNENPVVIWHFFGVGVDVFFVKLFLWLSDTIMYALDLPYQNLIDFIDNPDWSDLKQQLKFWALVAYGTKGLIGIANLIGVFGNIPYLPIWRALLGLVPAAVSVVAFAVAATNTNVCGVLKFITTALERLPDLLVGDMKTDQTFAFFALSRGLLFIIQFAKAGIACVCGIISATTTATTSNSTALAVRRDDLE